MPKFRVNEVISDSDSPANNEFRVGWTVYYADNADFDWARYYSHYVDNDGEVREVVIRTFNERLDRVKVQFSGHAVPGRGEEKWVPLDRIRNILDH